MIFRVPILISAIKPKGYSARPVFFPHPVEQDEKLNRLTNRIVRSVTKIIEDAGKSIRQDDCLDLGFSPDLSSQRVTFDIELRRRTEKVRYLLVTFRHLGKRVAFCPYLPEIWFEYDRGEDIGERASRVYTEYFRGLEREDEEGVFPNSYSITGQCWINTLELSITVPKTLPKKDQTPFFFFGGGGETADGASELARVGRCLDHLFPDELYRAILRNGEVEELYQALQMNIRRPILLLGPRLVGKTTILHEVVHRRGTERKSPYIKTRQTWLISPQRLISGMSYVGQWENRLLSIIKHVRKRDHVLVFDDLPGLFLAGQSANSTLNVAGVIKPYLERQEIRVVGEITPEAWQVVRERDRGLADMFHIIPVREPSDSETLRTLIGVQRRLESRQECGYSNEVLPQVVELQKRYGRGVAFPGKAAVVMERLGLRAKPNPNAEFGPFEPKKSVERDDVLLDFQAQTGLSIKFLDDRLRMTREAILEELRKLVIGQSEAVEALADVISIAKARINDQSRPWASFLFLGPTGVGKTELAKATAKFLFGDAKKLLRFDMNEYVDGGAAVKLVGSFSNPEGLLTAAVRRQPFSVILFDEIEKGHPEVFDLLLQVLGEGRLTDSLGRTADFTNTLIILTSNLGVREAENRYGLGGANANAARASYQSTAEKFFRPEFFNRLDRVIPFQRLTREQTATIAERLVGDVLQREGFRQRSVVLEVTPKALERVVNSGYDPLLGARAMKRAIERELTRTAAQQLAELPAGGVTVVRVDELQQKLSVSIQALIEVPPLPERVSRPAQERLQRVLETLHEIDDILDELRPTGAIGRNLTPEQDRYFALKEVTDEVRKMYNEIRQQAQDSRVDALFGATPDSLGRRSRYRKIKLVTNLNRTNAAPMRSIVSALALEEGVYDLFESAQEQVQDTTLDELERRVALLKLTTHIEVSATSLILEIHSFPKGKPSDATKDLREIYQRSLRGELGVDAKLLTEKEAPIVAFEVLGMSAPEILKGEVGTHLFRTERGELVPLCVTVRTSEDPQTEPTTFGPVVRVYSQKDGIIDLRTGITSGRFLGPDLFTIIKLEALLREQDESEKELEL